MRESRRGVSRSGNKKQKNKWAFSLITPQGLIFSELSRTGAFLWWIISPDKRRRCDDVTPVSSEQKSVCLCINLGALVPPGWRQTTPSRRRQSGFPSCTIRAPLFFYLSLSPLSALYLLNSVQPGCFTTCRGFLPSITAGQAERCQAPGPEFSCPGVRSLLWCVSPRNTERLSEEATHA